MIAVLRFHLRAWRAKREGNKVRRGKDLTTEAERLAAITLIPGNVYNPDVLDKIALARQLVEARALLQHASDKLRPYKHQLMMQFLRDEVDAFLSDA